MSPLRRGRVLGVALLALLTAVTALPVLRGRDLLRFAWFDALQRLAPRVRVSAPVVIVDVDGRSLARYGQWPWPRTLLAELIDRLAALEPAAIGVDIVMPEADRLSPQNLPALLPTIRPELAARLVELPSNDAVFAAALRGRRVVLGVVGLERGSESEPHEVGRTAPTRIIGGDPAPFLQKFDTVVRTVDEIEGAAAGHGLLTVGLEGRAVRRVPLVAMVGDVIVPTLALELFRVAAARPAVTIAVTPHGVASVGVGDLVIRTQPDGSAWLRYSRESGGARLVSAVDVLAGAVDRERFEGNLVLLGVTALGLADRQAIPGGGTREGVEIHAELIENIYEGTLLVRPRWANWAEAAFLLGGGALIIAVVPVRRARAVPLLLLPLLVVATGGSLALYRWRSLLVDAATPSLAQIVLFTVMLSATLAEAERQRRLLRRQVEQQREAAARIEGELSAARRIQLGTLPKPAEVLAGELRVSLDVVLEPAREVGGDLYDFFMLDRDHLFFLLGDVSGKGLPGSLFMAVSKSLYKSTALRRSGAAVATMMQEANAEISRDNPEALFVTVFAAVLNVETGVLEYCNAGHDQPYVVSPADGSWSRLVEGGGPPLCVLDDFEYAAATRSLRPGDTLCLVTDGVTEAQNGAGELFGRARLERRLEAVGANARPTRVVTAIREDVQRFVAGSEPADDLAILVLRWEGPGVSGR